MNTFLDAWYHASPPSRNASRLIARRVIFASKLQSSSMRDYSEAISKISLSTCHFSSLHSAQLLGPSLSGYDLLDGA